MQGDKTLLEVGVLGLRLKSVESESLIIIARARGAVKVHLDACLIVLNFVRRTSRYIYNMKLKLVENLNDCEMYFNCHPDSLHVLLHEPFAISQKIALNYKCTVFSKRIYAKVGQSQSQVSIPLKHERKF